MSLPIYTNPPTFLFFEINRRCNLRCNHCDFWQRDDKGRESYLQQPSLDVILRDFADLGGQKVVICGGEPLLDLQRYSMVCDTAHKHGLRVLSVVNGTRAPLRDADFEQLFFNAGFEKFFVNAGPDELSVSFDDFRESEHDYFRGRRGAYVATCGFVERWLRARARVGSDKKLTVMYLVHGGNYLELDRAYDWALKVLGVDKVKLNFIQPSFGGANTEPDHTYAKYSCIDFDRLIAVLREVSEKHGVRFRDAWLNSVYSYVKPLSHEHPFALLSGWHSGMQTSKSICNSYERNIMVSAEGRAQLCFNSSFGGVDLKQTNLKDFWQNAHKMREEMKECRAACGISHSVRAENCYEKGLTQ